VIAALTEKVLPARERFRLVLAGLDRAGLVRFGTEVVAAIRAAPLAQRLRLLWLETELHRWCEEQEPTQSSKDAGLRTDGLWFGIWRGGVSRAVAYAETCRERFEQLWREFGG
jgi:hypothetical protein